MTDPATPSPELWGDIAFHLAMIEQRDVEDFLIRDLRAALALTRAQQEAQIAEKDETIEIAHSALLGVEQAVLGLDRAGDDPDGAVVMALIAKQEAASWRAENAALRDNNARVKAMFDERSARLSEVEAERDEAVTDAAVILERAEAAEQTLSQLRLITDPWQAVHHLDPHQCIFGRFHPVEEVEKARHAERLQALESLASLRADQERMREALKDAIAKCDACDGKGFYWMPNPPDGQNTPCKRCELWRAALSSTPRQP